MKCEIIIDPGGEEQIVIRAHRRTELVDRIAELASETDTKTIVGYSESDAVILSQNEIECITVVNGKTVAYTGRGEFRLRERLYTLEDAVGEDFIKINKSTLANIRKISKFSASVGGALLITFKCGYRDYVSRRQLKAVKERLV